MEGQKPKREGIYILVNSYNRNDTMKKLYLVYLFTIAISRINLQLFRAMHVTGLIKGQMNRPGSREKFPFK
ncbi:unnamed protein product [Debaryomyces fabryi]|nr:unnamed protein product [Debaryomyces fabryi]